MTCLQKLPQVLHLESLQVLSTFTWESLHVPSNQENSVQGADGLTLLYFPELCGMSANTVTHLGPSGGQARFLSMTRNSMLEACLVVFWHFCLQSQMETKHERTSYSNSLDTPKLLVMFGTKIVGWKRAERRVGTNNFSLFPSRLGLWKDACFLYLTFPLRCTPECHRIWCYWYLWLLVHTHLSLVLYEKSALTLLTLQVAAA